MGISGLLPFLENASKRCHVAEFRGCTVAIDTYCWLHKGAFGCSEKLFKGEQTNSYVLYCMKYIRMLQSYDIRPILVFDGQNLVAKLHTEQKRREQRAVHEKRATELLQQGKLNEARNEMKYAININHKMALEVIKECRKIGVDCIVAPYEADAQLAFLNLNEMVHFVISEDSDLLLYGCKKVLYKMDVQGYGTLVEADKINSCMKLRPEKYTFDKFRQMCILSGCDYLESLPGVGLKKALKFISLTENPSIYDVLLKIPSYLKLNVVVTNEYRDAFMLADATFKHQYVYDPTARKLVRLTDLSVYQTKEEYCRNAGNIFNGNLAFNLALGNVDPSNLQMLDDWCPDKESLDAKSIWSRDYEKPNIPAKKLPAIKPPSTKNMRITVAVPSEQAKIEYDEKLTQELQYYKFTKTIEKLDTVEYCKVPNKQIEPAPIPFKRIKRNSKFLKTSVDTDETVTSRFFQSKTGETSKEKQESPEKNYDSFLNKDAPYSRKRSLENSSDQIIPESPIKNEENTEPNVNFDTPTEIESVKENIEVNNAGEVAGKFHNLNIMFEQFHISRKRRINYPKIGDDDEAKAANTADENPAKRAKTLSVRDVARFFYNRERDNRRNYHDSNNNLSFNN